MQCKSYTWVTRGTKMRNKIFVPSILVLPIFIPHFCSTDLFALALGVPPCHPMAEGQHHFLFRHGSPPNFCSANFSSANFYSADLFALALGVPPATQWPRAPTIFCSTMGPHQIFVPPILVPPIFILHFCSTDLFALTLGVPPPNG